MTTLLISSLIQVRESCGKHGFKSLAYSPNGTSGIDDIIYLTDKYNFRVFKSFRRQHVKMYYDNSFFCISVFPYYPIAYSIHSNDTVRCYVAG